MKLTPQFFITADTHFGHVRMPELSGRPKDFNERIVKDWNHNIGKKDKVLHLGDLVLTNKADAFKYCSQLNGEKYLIRGNHDGHSDTWYKDLGFTTVEPIYKVFYDKNGQKNHFLFTHEPVVPLPKGWLNVHGHLHGDLHRAIDVSLENHFDAGVDCSRFYPFTLYNIMAYFKEVEPDGVDWDTFVDKVY